MRLCKILLAINLLLLAACGPAGQSWQRIEQSGLLRVGLDPTYPPFEFHDGQTVQGLDVDLAKALAADLGLTVQFVSFGYDGLYAALETGQVDVLISALVIQEDKMADFGYSEPYFNAGQLLVVPAGSPITRIEDLSGRSLAVELGAEGHVLATRYTRRLPNLTVQTYPTANDALGSVVSGRDSAAIVDAISARMYPAGITILPDPLTVEPFALVVRIDDHELLQHLNNSLARLAQSGQLTTLTENWLQP